jgi:hypothetical protein
VLRPRGASEETILIRLRQGVGLILLRGDKGIKKNLKSEINISKTLNNHKNFKQASGSYLRSKVSPHMVLTNFAREKNNVEIRH